MAFAEFVQQVSPDPLIPLGTPQPLVTVRADHRYVVSVQPDYRGVKRAATKVENKDVPHVPAALVILVRKGGGDRLRQDVQDVQAGDLTGPAGGLAFGHAKVRRDGNHY